MRVTPPVPRVLVFSEAEAVAQVAAGMVIEAAKMAVHERDRFLLALSGGATPRGLYEILASPACDSVIPWAQTHFLWSDERCVPPDDPRSNYRLVEEAGLLRRQVAATHRMPGELPPEAGAARYEDELAGLGTVGAPGGRGLDLDGPGTAAGTPGADLLRPPRLDLVLLGLGEDGHTASLFPSSPLLGERRRLVAAAPGPDGLWRLTLTPAVLGEARRLLFLVTGRTKAESVAGILSGAAPDLPAARVMAGGARVTMLLDQTAAGLLFTE